MQRAVRDSFLRRDSPFDPWLRWFDSNMARMGSHSLLTFVCPSRTMHFSFPRIWFPCSDPGSLRQRISALRLYQGCACVPRGEPPHYLTWRGDLHSLPVDLPASHASCTIDIPSSHHLIANAGTRQFRGWDQDRMDSRMLASGCNVPLDYLDALTCRKVALDLGLIWDTSVQEVLA